MGGGGALDVHTAFVCPKLCRTVTMKAFNRTFDLFQVFLNIDWMNAGSKGAL